ncbi:PREDICTED: tetratricopeptide repeat protein 21B-like [Dufourea novaeangliae]|uniref:tetratricopeptide repeat protein 21B-like n=1 Tax=Dufourea novaeangliae TaxID=178035 RepID=UPI000767DB2A|nr:PREDICTED: tetratricopeptide repeat protein 21B-like [Dufourea novaeangliae]
MEEIEYITLIEWYCHQLYYNGMLIHSKEACEAYPTSERLRILLGLAYALTGKTQEAIKECTSLMNNADATLAALLLQNITYTISSNVERTTLTHIENRIRDERRKSTPNALSLAALTLLLSQKVEKAKDYIERAHKLDSSNMNVLLVKGWVNLFTVNEISLDKRNFFELVLEEDPKNVYALLGSAKYKQQHGDSAGAILTLNSLIVRYPKLCLPLIEKLQNLLTMKDWEQVLETANRILSIDLNNLDATKAQVFVMLCRDGNYEEGLKGLQSFFRNLILTETRNAIVLISNVQLFSRLACKSEEVLLELARTVDRMLQQQHSKNAELMIELGNLYVSLGKARDAEHYYKNAIKINESSFSALMGLAYCQLLDTSTEGRDLAQQQIDFLMEIQSGSKSAELLFMSAKLKSNVPNQALTHLDDASTILLNNCKCIPYGYEYVKKLNPDLCLDICKQRIVYSISNDVRNRERNVLNRAEPCLYLLEQLTEAYPGLTTAQLLLSKAKMQSGELEGAATILKNILDNVDASNAEAHLLMAQILACQGNYQLASQSLEIGLSYNFNIRDNPIYHLIVGMVQKENKDIENAIKSFRAAIAHVVEVQFHENMSETVEMSASDIATLYLELIFAYSEMRRFDEAIAVIHEANIKLRNTTEEGRILIGNAELLLEMGELDEAIERLSKVTPDQPYYLQAHKRLAEIHLKHKKDRLAFAVCFRELVEHCPGPRTYSMLGDAYVSIEEPERAIEAYEEALKENPIDKFHIASKLGKALVKTHQYTKAINYYWDVIKQENFKGLKSDLAKLFMKMKQYDKAEATLVQELQDGRRDSDLQSLQVRGQLLLLLGKTREKADNIQGALWALSEAKENQQRYIQRLGSSSTEDEKEMLTNICLTMAHYSSSLRDYDQAIQCYKEALNHRPANLQALLSLAKIYMQTNNLDRCAQSCTALLNADPENEAASIMMADLAFRKIDFDTAAFHFKQLLLKQPTYWTALARLIEVSRRTGNMDDLEERLHRADLGMSGSNLAAGYYYCAGLLDWRMGRLNSALRQFNCARRDAEWGQQAIYNMIEICLDSDDDSSLSNEVFNNDDDAEYQDSRTMALKTAYRLLQELNPKGSPHEMLTHRLLSNFFLLATKQKSNVEKALQDCTAMASQEALRDHVGPALGMAMAHILLKQTPRARNHLKRVSKNTWTFEDAEYLERCWLLLADIYVQSNKYDLANDLLRRVLQHNATCVRARELSGRIAEKEQSYREAASQYSQAWKYGGKSNLSVAYKLAYCSMKAKAYAEAIDACNEVLKQSPDYPRIRKDIFEKCINNLRT